MENDAVNTFKVIVDTKILSNILSNLLTIVERTGTEPVYNNVKLEIINSVLAITATDRELSACYNIPINTEEKGCITVNARLFNDIIRKINDKEVHLSHLEDNQLYINIENCQFSLSTLPHEKFRSIKFYDEQICFDILASKFIKILENTIFSVSIEETRYNLNGVYLHVNDSNMLCAVATDCHRLALSNSDIEIKHKFGIILPKKAVEEIIKLFKNLSENISIKLNSKVIELASKMVTLTSKLIDGTFPEYNEFIPYNNFNKLNIKTKKITETIDRVSTVTVEKSRAIKMNINQDSIECSAVGQIQNLAKEVIPLREKFGNYVGENIIP